MAGDTVGCRNWVGTASTSGKRSGMLLRPNNTQESPHSRELFSSNISSSTVEKPCSSHTELLFITQDHQASSYFRAFALAVHLDPQTHYMCVYTYVCIHTHTCIHVYTYYIHVCAYTYVFMHILCVCTCMCVNVYACIHVYIHICIYMPMCIMCLYNVQHIYTHMYTIYTIYIYTHASLYLKVSV